jgi:hypothetical protein
MQKTHRVATAIVCEKGRHVKSRMSRQVLSELEWRSRKKIRCTHLCYVYDLHHASFEL